MGRLFVVGIGPGNASLRTAQAEDAVRQSDLIVGYPAYLDLAADLIQDKETFTTPMRGETARCRRALEEAQAGKTVSLLCSGDAGVYGMASPVLELAEDYPDADVEIVPGITAALSGAAVLGAPLANDFCVVSLSDLLTPWNVIERRLRAAALGDFALVLYNPSSRKRKDHLRRACDILLANGKGGDTTCGYVRQIAREGQEAVLCTLAELREAEVDMTTTVFVGTKETRRQGGKLITPRGYHDL